MFEVRNIAFSYGPKEVLKDVSFAVNPGETICIVGENGAGKTTLLRILAGVMMPDAGVLRIDGRDLFKDPLKYRKNLGYLQEKPSLYEDMTVKSYLVYRARLKGEPDKRIRRRIIEASSTCKIKELLNRPIRKLSLGAKKRVAFADAILLRPRVILLDDVLSGFDCSMRDSIGEIITSVSAFSSVIVTGHEIAELAKLAKRFLVLSKGEIACSIETKGLAVSDAVSRVNAALKGGES